jgi:hypothetical protein
MMTPSWKRQLLLLSKVADVVFENLAGSIEAWNSESPRPLFLVRIVFPFLSFRLCQLCNTPKEKRQRPFWFIAWMCSATCTIVGSSAGDVEQANLFGLLPVFFPLSQIWFVFLFSF